MPDQTNPLICWRKLTSKCVNPLNMDPTPSDAANWLDSNHPCNRMPDAPHLAAGRVLRVLSVAAVELAVVHACETFEQDGLWQIEVRFNTAPELTSLLSKGQRADVWIAPAALLAQAAHAGVVNEPRPLAQVGVGVAVVQGQALPDVSTVTAWVQALQSAPSIFYTHASSGQHVHAVLSSMGLLPHLAHKIRRFDVGEDMLIALSQMADPTGAMALGAISEIRRFSNRGLAFAGPLPEPIAHRTVYAIATDPLSPRLSMAKQWVQVLKQASIWGDAASTGMEPIG